MAFQPASNGSFSIKAYIGDNKTLLAFNFSDPARAKDLAGFTIQCQPPGMPARFLLNELQFPDPTRHAQLAGEPANSSVNAPYQKYRWTHVAVADQNTHAAVTGNYTYTVTPRYFDANHSMKPLDASLSAKVTVAVGPFKKGSLSLGFTRGYMQSEGFVRHFGPQVHLQPPGKPLLYDTTQQAGTNPAGKTYTFEDEYVWMGSTARQQVLAFLNTALNDATVHVDVFAYDLSDPTIMSGLLTLGKQGRVRIILDNASLHVTDPKTGKVPPEDQFAALYAKQAKDPKTLVRGCFDRFSHDKIFILSRNGSPFQVITGSTNWSVTGLYVNANHVLVFDDANVAAKYSEVFAKSFQILGSTKTPSKAASGAFAGTPLAAQPVTFQSASVPRTIINFSPHAATRVTQILNAISAQINAQVGAKNGSVLFAVMQMTGSQSPVLNTLNSLHAKQNVYSYGISDAPQGTFLYAPGTKNGVMVTGKPGQTILPPPFDQVPTPPGHEIHDKFVVCGLNGSDPVVYCGSSNLATGGEAANGDNLLEIHDADVATAFAIEALLLVDHYNFLDRMAKPKSKKPAGQKQKTAVAGVGQP
jgi:phospholipase D-like protein